MRLLVVGGNGLLGSNLVQVATRRGWEVCTTYHSSPPASDVPKKKLDLKDHGAIGQVISEYRPDVVVNAGAMTDVDACEERPEEAFDINARAPGELAAQCANADIDVVHTSTDYVFDGTSETRYPESAETNPLQVYGETKLIGEQKVLERARSALVPRLSFVWGIHRSSRELTGFPAWLDSKLRAEEEVPLFTDQWVTPTRAGKAAETILSLAEKGNSGLFNIASQSCVTPFEFGTLILKRIDRDPGLLTKGSMLDVERPADRPGFTCLDTSKVERSLGWKMPSLREDLSAVEGYL